LKKQIISVFEPMYVDILNDDMVCYANISARGMLDHLFETYGNITAVDLEVNFENTRRSWDPQQPVETLFKQIQDCADYSEAGGVLIGHPQQINVGYAKLFATGHFMSACRRWNEKPTAETTWTQFKSHFAAVHRQHKQMQGESAATSVYHSANADVTQNEDQMAEATIGIRKFGNSNGRIQRCCGRSHSGKFSSHKTTGGQLHRVEGTEGVAQSGTA
jgi:hypothetical protein